MAQVQATIVLIVHSGATIGPQAFPDATLAVNDFLPG